MENQKPYARVYIFLRNAVGIHPWHHVLYARTSVSQVDVISSLKHIFDLRKASGAELNIRCISKLAPGALVCSGTTLNLFYYLRAVPQAALNTLSFEASRIRLTPSLLI